MPVTITKQDVQKVDDHFFIAKHNVKFYKFLDELDDTSKHLIRNNKQLNEMYDLFLDFIIDSSRFLDSQTKE